MKLKVRAVQLVGLLLATVGSTTWISRLQFEPNKKLQDVTDLELRSVQETSVTDLSRACAFAESQDGWLLFILKAELIADNKFRTYFETAEEPVGLWVEYDDGLLRLAQGLGSDSPKSNTEIPIRVVRKNESAFVAIAVWRDGTRVITNAVDKRNNWPGSFTGWSCDAVQIGGDSRELSQGHGCPGCAAQLSYATGQGIADLQVIMNELSNVSEFNLRRSVGSALTFVGILIVMHRSLHLSSIWRRVAKRRTIRRLDSGRRKS
jgi:hypothetical protein